ncbi:MAG: cysteine desulfurase, partial [Rhizobiales bacterium]|nr:cysteine desulfurase [Hyphomicrobiales bacterium]
GWAVIAVVLLLGGVIRHYFNTRNAGIQLTWQPAYIAASVALAVGLIFLVSWRPSATASAGAVSDERAFEIVETRCVTCHAQFPSDEDFEEAPGEVIFADVDDLRRYNEQIIKQAVVSKAMPLANKTRMTPDERAELGAWLGAQ